MTSFWGCVLCLLLLHSSSWVGREPISAIKKKELGACEFALSGQPIESSLLKSQSRYQQLVKSHDARLTPLVAMLPPESAGMWLGDGLTRGKGAWLGDVRRKKGDPRRWARVRRESRPLPRTPLRCTRPAMTQQGVVRGRSSGDLHVRHDHVNADGARAASTKRARLEGGQPAGDHGCGGPSRRRWHRV